MTSLDFGSITFIYTAIALVAWFVLQNNREWSRVLTWATLSGIGIHIFSSLLPEFSASKLSMLTIDILALAAAGILFMGSRLIKVNRIIAGLIIVAGLLGYQKIRPILKLLPFSASESTIITSDEEGVPEFLVQMNPRYVNNFNSLYEGFIESTDRAFFSTSLPNTDLDDFYLVNVKNASVEDFLKAQKDDPNILYIENNEEIHLDDPVSNAVETKVDLNFNDPMLANQWALNQIGISGLQKVLSESKKKPKKKALLAILDTGVDGNHEDIKTNFKSTHSKYDKDKKGHGTHCAGIAGAVVNNGKGVASPNLGNDLIDITSVKVLSDFGGGTQAGIINGMIEAADNGADVISMSLGGFSSDAKQKAYSEAVKYCNDKGAIVVAAAGNAAQDASKYSPANADNVICVAATDSMGQMASFSNKIDNVTYGVYAPGKDILSTTPGDNYETYSGTSMATPYVSSLVAILKAYKPDISTKEVYELLGSLETENSSDKVKPIDFGGSLGKLLK